MVPASCQDDSHIYYLLSPMGTETELLRGYLDARDAAQEDALLAALVFDTASPLIRKTVARRLMSSPPQDREDVAGDVILDLVSRLKRLKEAGDAPIERFAAYVSVAAHNGCDQYLRQRYPQRHRLKNRLRYLLSKTPAFALWEDSERGWVCGRAIWQGRAPVPLDPELIARLGPRDRPPPQLLADLFNQVGAPVEFEALTGIFAVFWGVRDSVSSLELVENAAVAPDPQADTVMVQKQALERLWGEILELPAQQRSALLLNLRDATGGSALWMIPGAGVATVRRIAESVGISAEEFAALWGRLPLGDLEIGERLGLARQQVINLRQAARQRLGRRLRPGNTAAVQAAERAP
jgi:RNA polymerase sigma factor (sigma-70 family)